MSFISNVEAYTYTDKISAISVAPSPYNNTGNNYNTVYIGTSNGHVYLFNERSNTIQTIVPTGYNGTLSGEITGIAVDPTGKYLFLNAPYDSHCLRISLISVPFQSELRTLTVPIDLDIYQFGDNTGNIVVDSQGVVYIVTGNGTSVSTMERYGNSFVDLLFLNRGPALNFKGITLSPNEQRIYAADAEFGSIYYYDFLSNQPTFNAAQTTGAKSTLQDINTSGNNLFYTQKDGIYVKNTYLGTCLRIVGNGSSGYVATTDPQQFTLSGTNTVTSDSFGNLYLSSSNSLGDSSLYKVTFGEIVRNNYRPPPARQELPILQPYPTTSCKRIVEPFSPRIRFGWGLTNTRKLPVLDVFKSPLCCPPPIVNCPVTPFYCPPTPPPVIPLEPTPPVYPITVTTRQFGDHASGTGSRGSISTDATVLANTSLTFVAQASVVQPGLGPLGEVYYLGVTGTLNKLYGGNVVWSFSANAPTRSAGPVISPTGAIIIATDNGTVYRLDSNAGVLSNYPIQLGQQITGSPASITNPASDYFVVGYGNTLTAFTSANASLIWSVKTQTPGELYRGSASTDGINIFMASTNKKVYCYVAETGVLNWVYSISSSQTAPFTPYATAKNVGITLANDSNIIVLSNTTVRSAASDIIISIPGIQIVSPPVISTDSQGILWAHVITSTGVLYGFGGLFPTPTYNGYQYSWSNVNTDAIPSSYQIPVIDSAGYIYVSSKYGVVNQYYAYYTGGDIQFKNTSLIINGTETIVNPPIQVSLTPLITSQNTMYVIGRNTLPTSPTYETNYMYTLSGDVITTRTPILVFGTQTEGLPGGGVSWKSVASSSDGKKLVACGGNSLYTSVNYGNLWTERKPTPISTHSWVSVASSADGLTLYALDDVANSLSVYKSSDGGRNWSLRQISGSSIKITAFKALASSSEGSKLVAAGVPALATVAPAFGGTLPGGTGGIGDIGDIGGIGGLPPPTDVTGIITGEPPTIIDAGTVAAAGTLAQSVVLSSNGGTTWSSSTTGLPGTDSGTIFSSVTSSSDGTKLAVSDGVKGVIYTSSNQGLTWTSAAPTASTWTCITSSTDGMKLAVCSRAGLIYTSSDRGLTWTQSITGLPVGTPWISIASSADGLKLVVCSETGLIYTSSDKGLTWTRQTNGVPVGAVWRSIASSYSGNNLALVGDNGIVCTAYQVV